MFISGAEDVVLDFRKFWRSHFHAKDEHADGGWCQMMAYSLKLPGYIQKISKIDYKKVHTLVFSNYID